jgi:AbrB family looped-hinge helix DNA binding protein
MAEIRTKLAEGGRIVIPAEYRLALNLHVGDEIILHLEDGALRIYTPSQAIKYAQEMLHPHLPRGRSLSDELIVERRKEE